MLAYALAQHNNNVINIYIMFKFKIFLLPYNNNNEYKFKIFNSSNI